MYEKNRVPAAEKTELAPYGKKLSLTATQLEGSTTVEPDLLLYICQVGKNQL